MNTKSRGNDRGKWHPSLLDEVLERRMLLYVLAAGATLASASAAQAKVVFTPDNATLRLGGELPIDMNHDGTIDFNLYDIMARCTTYRCSSFATYSRMYAKGVLAANAIAEGTPGAAALRKGAWIGSGQTFGSDGLMEEAAWWLGGTVGSFVNVARVFLGVRFLINGETHYGWIGFRTVNGFTATLGGWAYETVPSKAIRAGDKGQDDSSGFSAIEPTSLELLAAGHVAIAERRRRIAA